MRGLEDKNQILERALHYADSTPPAIAGQQGHTQTFSLACKLVHGFALGEEDALKVLIHYNSRCQPEWSKVELEHKVASAKEANYQKPRGHMLGKKRSTSRFPKRIWRERISPPKLSDSKPAGPAYVESVPENAPPPDWHRLGLAGHSMTWPYHDEDGKVVGYTVRMDKPDGSKIVVPVSWHDDKWVRKAMPVPRPLYALKDAVHRPEAVIILVEGEKAADAAQRLIPDAVCMTWAGGCKASQKIDWSPLKDRNVILWPDYDDSGKRAMEQIQDILLRVVGAKSCKLVQLPQDLPGGWDAADALEAGWTTADVLELFRGRPTRSWQHTDYDEPPGSLDYDEWEAARAGVLN